MDNAGTGGQMAAPPDETTADPYAVISALRAERDAALAREAATAEVLQVIKSSGGDLTPVFDAILERAHSLCGAFLGGLWTYDGERFRAVATRGYPGHLVEMIRRPIRGTVFHQRLVHGEHFVHVLDVLAEVSALTDPVVKASTEAGNRTFLAVPLRKDGTLLGHISAARSEVRAFSDQEILLLENFADQAVIAMENARLITEQREALEQQTATAEVLGVINSNPGDLAPVFDVILEKAHGLCGIAMGSLELYDGQRFRAVAVRGLSDAFADMLRRGYPASENPATGPLIDGGRLTHIRDLLETDYAITRSGAELDAARTLLCVPLRREGTLLGMIASSRKEVQPFSDKEIALLENFAAQAVIAMENARLLTEQREALEQQTATAEVLGVINRSPGNLIPVFDAILDKAHILCGAVIGSLVLYDGTHLRAAATHGHPEPYATVVRRPQQFSKRTQPLLDGARFVHVLDVMSDEEERDHEVARSRLGRTDIRTALWMPLRKDGTLLGFISAYRTEVLAFTERQIALLENFAAQAVIAMDNARLLTEQREALERQTAMAEVLQVINASPGDLMPVFDAILEKAMRLCGAAIGGIYGYDGQWFHPVALRGVTPAFAAFSAEHPVPSGPNSAPMRLLRTKRPAQIPDLVDGSDYTRGMVGLGGIRALLDVPLLKEDALLGFIAIYREKAGVFSDKQIALLENFADQAVVAMENARLLTEQREALEQQTAMAEVLQIINASPGNLTPVFGAMLDRAMWLCEAAFGELYSFDNDVFNAVADQGVPVKLSEFRKRNPTSRDPRTVPGRIRAGENVLHILDCKAEDTYQEGEPTRRALVDLGGARTVLAVSLKRDEALLGMIMIYRQEVKPFSDRQIMLLENFAAQAVIAMENARLLDEIRQRQEELRVTFENMGDGVAMFDETPRLVAWNRKFQDILNLPDGVLAERLTFAEYIRYLTERGEFGAGADLEEQIRRLTGNIDQYRAFERMRPDGRVIEVRHNPVPGGGFVLIYADITERKRNEAEIRAARDAAEEASRTIEAAYRDLKAAQANLIQAEKMASLGQLTAGIAHEIKNPLNFVNNFAELSGDLLDELNDAVAGNRQAEIDELRATLQGNLAKITEHGRRADAIVRSMLEHSRGSSGERRKVDINTLVDEALNLAYHGARAQDQTFNVTLERDFGEGIAPVEVVPQDMTRVFLNLFSNGFYAVCKRGAMAGTFEPTLRLTTRDLGDEVEIRVRDNGTGMSDEVRGKVFEPFFTTKPVGEGTGLGLSLSYDIIVKQHAGRLSVDSRPNDYTEFLVVLPRRSVAGEGAGA
jgi:PAS domain S-box-containing protein